METRDGERQAAFVQPVSDASELGALIHAHPIVVVDYWAPWCRPCLAIAPAIEGLAAMTANAVKFIKVDASVEGTEGLCSVYPRVSSLPTFHVFANGVLADVVVGADLGTVVQTVARHYTAVYDITSAAASLRRP